MDVESTQVIVRVPPSGRVPACSDFVPDGQRGMRTGRPAKYPCCLDIRSGPMSPAIHPAQRLRSRGPRPSGPLQNTTRVQRLHCPASASALRNVFTPFSRRSERPVWQKTPACSGAFSRFPHGLRQTGPPFVSVFFCKIGFFWSFFRESLPRASLALICMGMVDDCRGMVCHAPTRGRAPRLTNPSSQDHNPARHQF